MSGNRLDFRDGAGITGCGYYWGMRITTKGQVTIPQEIREELGLLPNTRSENHRARLSAVTRHAYCV